MKISIRSKVFLYLFLFLGIGAGAYAVLSSRLFRTVVVPMNRELNESSAKWMGSLLEKRVSDFRKILERWANDPDGPSATITDPDWLASEIYQNTAGSADWIPVSSALNSTAGMIDKHHATPPPFAKILSKSTVVFNTFQPGPSGNIPYLSLGVALPAKDGLQRIGVIDFKPDALLKLLRFRDFSDLFLTDYDGEVVLHRDPDLFSSRPSWSDNPLVREVNESGEVISRAFTWKGARYSGSVWNLPEYQIKVIAQVNDDRIQEPVRVLGVKTLIFFAWIAATALVLASYLTRLLTEQERNAAKAIEEARSQVNQTQDEASLQAEKNELEILREITKGWRMSYQASGWEGLIKDLKRPVNGFESLLEEDLANLEVITEGQLKRHDARAKMARQVKLDLTRASEILDEGKGDEASKQ
ncbi:MAG: cache domain-containing protein [Bdellovibrionales bacterium]|nr:cache domain-containing protein [Bdellovibrionales bacterium]